MNYISTTDLRTMSKQLVSTLISGRKVSLVHRSKIIAEILPVKTGIKTFDAVKFKKTVKQVPDGKRLSVREREKIYRRRLTEKYG